MSVERPKHKKRSNRQHAAKGASWLRAATDYRRRSKEYFSKWDKSDSQSIQAQHVLILAEAMEQCAQVCSTEGKTVRHLR